MSFLQSERIIEVQDQQEMVGILGRNDELLRVIKEHYESVIVARGNVIVFSGEDNEGWHRSSYWIFRGWKVSLY